MLPVPPDLRQHCIHLIVSLLPCAPILLATWWCTYLPSHTSLLINLYIFAAARGTFLTIFARAHYSLGPIRKYCASNQQVGTSNLRCTAAMCTNDGSGTSSSSRPTASQSVSHSGSAERAHKQAGRKASGANRHAAASAAAAAFVLY